MASRQGQRATRILAESRSGERNVKRPQCMQLCRRLASALLLYLRLICRLSRLVRHNTLVAKLFRLDLVGSRWGRPGRGFTVDSLCAAEAAFRQEASSS
eukprot:6209924-Pleurochrysis_carterae.AAC.4